MYVCMHFEKIPAYLRQHGLRLLPEFPAAQIVHLLTRCIHFLQAAIVSHKGSHTPKIGWSALAEKVCKLPFCSAKGIFQSNRLSCS